MALFSNGSQNIPQRFIEKQEVDAKVKFCYEGHIAREGNVIHIDNLREMREELKPLKEHQRALYISCDNFVKEQKARGPEGLA